MRDRASSWKHHSQPEDVGIVRPEATGSLRSTMQLETSKNKLNFQLETTTKLTRSYRYLFHCKDALEAEISATLEGLSLSLSMQQSELPIIIHSDSSTVIAALTNDSLDRSAYGHLMMEIKKMLALRVFIPLKVDRSQNRVAHSVANIDRSGGCTACWC